MSMSQLSHWFRVYWQTIQLRSKIQWGIARTMAVGNPDQTTCMWQSHRSHNLTSASLKGYFICTPAVSHKTKRLNDFIVILALVKRIYLVMSILQLHVCFVRPILTTIQLNTTSKLNQLNNIGDKETFFYFRGLCRVKINVPFVKSWGFGAVCSLQEGHTLPMIAVGPVMGLMNEYCVWENKNLL